MEQGDTLTKQHRSLHRFEGEWQVEQKLWYKPDAEPMTSKGRATWRVVAGGTAAIKELELDGEFGSFRGAGLFAYSKNNDALQGAWVDGFLPEGILTMEGRLSERQGRPQIEDDLARQATEIHNWTFSKPAEAFLLGGDVAADPSSTNGALPREGRVPMLLVENQINDGHWVLEFYALTGPGEQQLVMQNTYTRQ
jgi:hypothetical protein